MKSDENALIRFCRTLPGAEEDVKWGNDLVFSVCGKMFCVFVLPQCDDVTVKVDKEEFLALTEQPGIVPAPYLARHGWVTIEKPELFTEDSLQAFVQTSWDLVVAKLPKSRQSQLKGG